MLILKEINRSEVSRQTHVDVAHISRIFNKKSRPSLPLALSISAHLGVTVEELCKSLGIGVDLGCTST